MIDLNNYLRKDIAAVSGGTATYYGYSSNNNAADTDTTWFMRKVFLSTSGTTETVTWTNGSPALQISVWANRTASFTAPSGSMGLTCSTASVPLNSTTSGLSLNITWVAVPGIDRYRVMILESGKLYSDRGAQLYSANNNNFFTKEVVNTGASMGFSYPFASSGLTYSITVTGINLIGSTSSSFNIFSA